MESLGQYLQSLREEKHISIDKVNNDLRISTEYISAIESNRLSMLGNHGFARAIVYTYARYLEADEKTVMYLFDLTWPPQNTVTFSPKVPLKEKKVLISTNFIWLITIIIIVIVLSFVIWISYSKGYLKRPFDKEAVKQDSVEAAVKSDKTVEKPDTLRQRMLSIVNETAKDKKSSKVKTKPVKKSVKTSLPDTTDYVNDLIFDSADSPFNAIY